VLAEILLIPGGVRARFRAHRRELRHIEEMVCAVMDAGVVEGGRIVGLLEGGGY
jgi:hypothetical protein